VRLSSIQSGCSQAWRLHVHERAHKPLTAELRIHIVEIVSLVGVSALTSPHHSPKTAGPHLMLMSQLTKTKELLVRTWTALRNWTVPQDGIRRYLYDIWQPLTILVLTASFAATFFTFKDPYASTSDLFFCNADGKVQMLEDGPAGYKPFWDPNLFFTINVPVGNNLSFTLAKLIDAIWDLGVGRGGQLLAAVVAYRVVRRSLTLVMESCTVTIPTVISFCCERLTIQSSYHLLRDVFSSRSSRQHAGKRLSPVGRQRLLLQLSACVYVLVFPTLTSVMTGYRTGFTGVFNYTNDTTTEVKPLAQIGYPRLMIIDGSRIGLANSTAYLPRQIPFPKGVNLTIMDFLLSSESFKEPAGVLTDCKCGSNLLGLTKGHSNLLAIRLLHLFRGHGSRSIGAAELKSLWTVRETFDYRMHGAQLLLLYRGHTLRYNGQTSLHYRIERQHDR